MKQVHVPASLGAAALCLQGTMCMQVQVNFMCFLPQSKLALVCRCASDAEEQSALYNMACAYAALGKRDSALTCLEVRAASGCLVLGSSKQQANDRLLLT